MALADRYASASPGEVVLLLLPHSCELFLLHLGLILRGRSAGRPAVAHQPYRRRKIPAQSAAPARQPARQPDDHPAAPGGQYGPLAAVSGDLLRDRGRQPLRTGLRRRGCTWNPGKRRASAPQRPAPSGRRPVPAVLGRHHRRAEVRGGDRPHARAQLRDLREALDFGSRRQRGFVAAHVSRHGVDRLPLVSPVARRSLAALHRQPTGCCSPICCSTTSSAIAGPSAGCPISPSPTWPASAERMRGAYDVSSMRGWINCSEPVRQRSLQAFAGDLRRLGRPRGNSSRPPTPWRRRSSPSPRPASARPPRRFPRNQVRERRRRFSGTGLRSPRRCVRLERLRVSQGTEVRIVDPAGRPCDEARPGAHRDPLRIAVLGLLGQRWLSHQLALGEGWYASGDYGFQAGGQLYVIGRIKDIVIVGGQNVFPEDVETGRQYPARDLPRPGRRLRSPRRAVPDRKPGRGGGAARAYTNEERARAVERQIQQLVLASIGVAARFVKVVPERWIVKSTAGKISRRDTRARFLQETGAVTPAVS